MRPDISKVHEKMYIPMGLASSYRQEMRKGAPKYTVRGIRSEKEIVSRSQIKEDRLGEGNFRVTVKGKITKRSKLS